MAEDLFYGASFDRGANLQATTFAMLADMIRAPNRQLLAQLKMLRNIRRLDQGAYRKRKAYLPWFIGSRFEGGIRNQNHFQHIRHFVLDFDHCIQDPDQLAAMRQAISADPRVALLFVSPGGDGLKVVFSLEKPISEPAAYANFYRAFGRNFAMKVGLEQYADLQTCDVSRVCFLSYDPDLFFREHPEKVVPTLPGPAGPAPEEPDNESSSREEVEEQQVPALNDDTFAQIRQKLGGRPAPRKKSYYVPDELRQIYEPLKAHLDSLGVRLLDCQDIQYGQKYCMGYGKHRAEINVFFGRRGFSVVKSPKNGTNPELAQLAHDIIHQFLFSPDQIQQLRHSIHKNRQDDSTGRQRPFNPEEIPF